MSNSPFIFEATIDNFQEKVMDVSATTPILVDVWADWCAPCKQLMPILEKLVEEYLKKSVFKMILIFYKEL